MYFVTISNDWIPAPAPDPDPEVRRNRAQTAFADFFEILRIAFRGQATRQGQGGMAVTAGQAIPGARGYRPPVAAGGAEKHRIVDSETVIRSIRLLMG